jgi:hypothetical protein
MIRKRDGRKEVLDITKIQKMTIEATFGLYELADEIKTTTDVALKKAKKLNVKLKEIEKGINKQLLITHIKLLSKRTNSNIITLIATIQTLLKNIFGNNNSTESDNNK